MTPLCSRSRVPASGTWRPCATRPGSRPSDRNRTSPPIRPRTQATESAEGAADDAPTADLRPTLDAADVSLALRYLTDFQVLVAVHPSSDLLAEAVSAAGWASARLVVVLESEGDVPDGMPADALVVAAAADDAEGVGARIGRYAAALSRGDDAAAAYRDLTAAPAT